LFAGTGFTLTSPGTIPATSLVDGAGTIVGAFTLLNQGTIVADGGGTVLNVDSGTLTNQGTILALTGTMIVQSNVVTNLSGGTLTGGAWDASETGTFELLTGAVVTDNATISLDGATAAFESGSGTPDTIDNSLTAVGTAGVLNLLDGASFQAAGSLLVNGEVVLGGGTLAAPSGQLTIGTSGDVAGFGVVDPGTPVADGGTIEAKGGTLTLPGASSITGLGTLQADPGGSLALQAFGGYSQSIVNNGVIDAVSAGIGGTLKFTGSYSGTGAFVIEGGPDAGDKAVLELPAGVSGNVGFDVNYGELLVDSASTFNGTVSGFNNNDSIVLTGISNAATATLVGNLLDLRTSGGTFVTAVTLNTTSANYSGATFSVFENLGSTKATVTVSGALPCFAAGTRIRTMTGDVNVERLAVGDIVRSHFAGSAPIAWLGHRHVNCRRHPDPSKVWPVLVSAHAFGPRIPECDLWLSPDHAVFVDDVLIPIKYLINGKTIVQRRVEEVVYYHVELGEHDVLLAEGMYAESYLENGCRAGFDNAGELVSLYPDFGARRREALGCAPFVVTGPKLDAVKASTRARMPKDRRDYHKMRLVA
jgi:collagen type I/II/III/V/XI/XXIV/XXVII alpha